MSTSEVASAATARSLVSLTATRVIAVLTVPTVIRATLLLVAMMGVDARRTRVGARVRPARLEVFGGHADH